MEEKGAIHLIRRESTRICTVTGQWLLQLATGRTGQRARVPLYVDGSIDQDDVVEGLVRGLESDKRLLRIVPLLNQALPNWSPAASELLQCR